MSILARRIILPLRLRANALSLSQGTPTRKREPGPYFARNEFELGAKSVHLKKKITCYYNCLLKVSDRKRLNYWN